MADRAPGAWPDLAGRLIDGGHMLPVRIYYEDTDFTGLVYHANYLRFMERGRSDFLRMVGIHHTELDRGDLGESLGFAIRRMQIEFIKPARIDDVVEVHTRTLKVTGGRINLEQAVRRDGQDLVTATLTIAVIGTDGRPRRVPRDIANRLGAPE